MGWRRQYLLLLMVRLYFALSPSYIHPDEHFQGPEVIAGEIFNWPTFKTWEFTSESPVRSFFPLWFIYGIPMQILDWIVPGVQPPSPMVTFYVLRTLFFLMSFVLEDWALQDLAANPRQRRRNLLLLASSYVTWTYQTHTFSNSIETINVLWALVLIERISKSKRTACMSSGLLGFIAVFGVFNRITFPAFLILPALRLIPHFLRHPLSLLSIIVTVALTFTYAIYLDTLFYNPTASFSIFSLRSITPVITPLNNLLYNTQTSNLALHGLHPRYTHLLVNLPQLLGPALISLIFSPTARLLKSPTFLSALGGLIILSILPHQEVRFLMPAVPLLLTVIPLPTNALHLKLWATIWMIFNLIYGVFMGSYHQAGIVPAQSFLASHTNASSIVYWKTYSPPSWLLGSHNERANITDLMGASVENLVTNLTACAGGDEYLVAPLSATKLDTFIGNENGEADWWLQEQWRTSMHLNMDDLDFEEEGLWGTVERVLGRRGLAVWKVQRRAGCNSRI